MAIVLFAAALHATWNALVRASADKFHDTVLIVFGAGAVAALLLPFLPVPAPARLFSARCVRLPGRRTEPGLSVDARFATGDHRGRRCAADR
jgi:hypothetical protein